MVEVYLQIKEATILRLLQHPQSIYNFSSNDSAERRILIVLNAFVDDICFVFDVEEVAKVQIVSGVAVLGIRLMLLVQDSRVLAGRANLDI